METVKAEIKLDSSQYKVLSEELKRLHLSIEELLNNMIQQYLIEISQISNQPTADFMSIVDLGESGLSDVSENHDKYLGEIIANEHLH
jgi:hypothetical protein